MNYIYYVLSAARVERRLLPPPADGEAPAKMPIRRATMLAKLNDYPIHQDRAWREFQALEQQATRTAANLDQGLKLIVDRQLLQIAKDQFHKNNPLTIESSSPADRQSRQIVGTVSPSPDTDAPAPMTANTPHEEEPATYDMGDMADAFQTALAWIENERIDADRAVLEWVDDAIANFQAWKRAQHSVPASLA